jgi:hypothetical protein
MKTSSWNFAESVMLAFNLKKITNVECVCAMCDELEKKTRRYDKTTYLLILFIIAIKSVIDPYGLATHMPY